MAGSDWSLIEIKNIVICYKLINTPSFFIILCILLTLLINPNGPRVLIQSTYLLYFNKYYIIYMLYPLISITIKLLHLLLSVYLLVCCLLILFYYIIAFELTIIILSTLSTCLDLSIPKASLLILKVVHVLTKPRKCNSKLIIILKNLNGREEILPHWEEFNLIYKLRSVI